MTEPRMCAMNQEELISLQWRHNECNSVSNHGRLDCLLNRLSRRKSKKTSKLSVTGLFEGNSPVTGEFPSQRASDEENVSIWWSHHVIDPAAGQVTTDFTIDQHVLCYIQ